MSRRGLRVIRYLLSRHELVAECSACGRRLACFVPKKGDGTARYMRRHRCKGDVVKSWVEARGWEMSRPLHP